MEYPEQVDDRSQCQYCHNVYSGPVCGCPDSVDAPYRAKREAALGHPIRYTSEMTEDEIAMLPDEELSGDYSELSKLVGMSTKKPPFKGTK